MTTVRPAFARGAVLHVVALRSLLGGGWLYLLLFVLVHAVLAWANDGPSLTDLAVLALVAAPQVVLIRRRTLELSEGRTWAVCGALVAAAFVGFLAMPPPGTHGTYIAWFLGAIALDLLGLTVLGRFAAAWTTMAAVVVLALLWGATGGGGTAAGLAIVVRHVATLLVGTAIAVGLRRSTAASTAFRALRLRRRAEEEATLARADARRTAAEHALEQAGPALAAVAAGTDFDEAGRRRLVVLEGALRDEIRTPGLRRSQTLRASLDAARDRGVDVLLMDEVSGAGATERSLAAEWLAERLDRTPSGSFVGRVRTAEDGVRVSAVRDSDGESTTLGVPTRPGDIGRGAD